MCKLAIGLGKENLILILEDALRHSEELTKSAIIEAVSTAIVENNKVLHKELKDSIAWAKALNDSRRR